MSINYADLPRETHLTLAEIATSKARGRVRKGITTLSPQIQRGERTLLHPRRGHGMDRTAKRQHYMTAAFSPSR